MTGRHSSQIVNLWWFYLMTDYSSWLRPEPQLQLVSLNGWFKPVSRHGDTRRKRSLTFPRRLWPGCWPAPGSGRSEPGNITAELESIYMKHWKDTESQMLLQQRTELMLCLFWLQLLPGVSRRRSGSWKLQPELQMRQTRHGWVTNRLLVSL